MEFEQQKPVTNEYRENWDRVFHPKVTVREALEYCGIPVIIDESIPPTEIHFHHPSGRVDKLVNIGAPTNA